MLPKPFISDPSVGCQQLASMSWLPKIGCDPVMTRLSFSDEIRIDLVDARSRLISREAASPIPVGARGCFGGESIDT